MNWLLARPGAWLQPFTVPCSLSPLTLKAYCLIRILHHTGPYTLKLLLPCSVCPLSSSLQWTQAFCYNLTSLKLKIFHEVPVVIQSRTPLISSCTVQLWTLWEAHSLATPFHSSTFGAIYGKLPSLCSSMVFRHAPIPHKGRVTTIPALDCNLHVFISNMH